MSKHARDIDPGPRIPTIELKHADGRIAIINAEPEFDGDEDNKREVKAHAKLVKEHQKVLAEWAERGFLPANAKAANAPVVTIDGESAKRGPGRPKKDAAAAEG